MKDLEDIISRKFRNKTKQRAYEIAKENNLRNKINDFDNYYKEVLHLATVESEMKRNKNKKIDDIILDMIREDAMYKSNSYLEKYEELSSLEQKQGFYAYSYAERTKSLRTKYGDEIVKYYGKEMTIEEHFQRYAQGKIGQRTMNRILKKFKKSVEYMKRKVGSD